MEKKTTHITYQSRQVNLEQLRRVAGQGTVIEVDGEQLNLITFKDADDNVILIDRNDELVVVAVGQDRYDVILGTPKRLIGKMKARLVSKIILKKAFQENIALANARLPEVERSWEAPRRYNDRPYGDRPPQRYDGYRNDRRY